MTSILLMISFLLHFILLAAVYHLHQQLQETKTARSQETELLLSRFLDEIKQENRQLQHQLQQQSKRSQPTEQSTETSFEHSSQVQQEPKNTDSFYRATEPSPNLPPISTEKEDKVETSLESHIFQLHKEGVPLEEIAKRVNRGKTEVDLLIKLDRHKS